MRFAASSSNPSIETALYTRRTLARLAASTATAAALSTVFAKPAVSLASSSELDALITAVDDHIDPATAEPAFTSRVYFDISVRGGKPRRFIVGCYGNLLPATVRNFEALALSVDAGYAHTPIYRLVPGLTVQMGDVLRNGGKSGRAAVAAGLTPTFPAESYRILHTVPGMVSMVRAPGGAVDSRFFVTTRPGDSGYLDVDGGRYVAFGRVIEGLEYLQDLDDVGSRGGDSRPLSPIDIVSCGIL
jgi:peptidyl-prolyl cis-trans isomerase B (cyclophilin B)